MVRQDLVQYVDRERELKHLEIMMGHMRERIESPRVTVLSNTPRVGGAHRDHLAENIATLSDLLAHYNEIWDEQIAVQRGIEDAIRTLHPRERTAIRLRYFEDRPWSYIGVKLECSDRHAQRILLDAEKKLLDGKPLSRRSASGTG